MGRNGTEKNILSTTNCQILSTHDIDLARVTNARAVRKMMIGLDAMASNDPKTAQELLLNQPDIVRYLREREQATEGTPSNPIDLTYDEKPDNKRTLSESSQPIKKERMEEQKEEMLDLAVIDTIPVAHMMGYHNPNELVTYGTISTGFSSVQPSILHSCIGDKESVEMNITAEPTGKEGVYALRVDSPNGLRVGYVDKKVCMVLSSTLKYVSVDGVVPKPASIVHFPILLDLG